jgi:hypothetical protein
MSIHSIITELHVTRSTLPLWILGIVVGSGIGWLQIHKLQPKIDKKNLLIGTEGSWVTIVLIILIFAYKYYLGFTLAMHPHIVAGVWQWCMLGFTGACTGVFFGRLLCYIYKFKTEQSTNLAS